MGGRGGTGGGTAAPPRQLLSRADRRATILRGAAQAFARTGFAGTSMDDVATATGVSRLIVYRHFDSKEALYRAVLERISERLAEEWEAQVVRPDHGTGARVLLTVAREEPDGFVLLWRHAAREAAFADYAAEHRERATGAALTLMAGRLSDRVVPHWAAATVVAALVEAVLAWLDEGDPGRDGEMVELLSAAVRAMVSTWSDTPAGPPATA